MIDQWTFIERAGRELGATPEMIRKWRLRSRGVSHKWRVPIIEIAEREGFALNRSAFDNPPSPKRPTNGEIVSNEQAKA